MPISVLNWAVTNSILNRDLPDAKNQQDEINRFSVLAALVPGMAGLMVPFIAEKSLLDDDTTTIDGGITQIAHGTTTIIGGDTTRAGDTTTNTGGTTRTVGGTITNTGGTVTGGAIIDGADEIQHRLDATDNKLADLGKKLDAETAAINQRFDTTNSKLDGLDTKLTDLLVKIGKP